jgi:DNA-binding transcriptional regulator LsrR (DeoR family)
LPYPPAHEDLTAQQYYVLTNAVKYKNKGLTNDEIGRLLGISAASISRTFIKARRLGLEV